VKLAIAIAAIVALLIAIPIALDAWVVKLYLIPSSSMEPTLHCARPAFGCRADHSDRIAVSRISYRIGDPERGDVVAFRIPGAAALKCGGSPDSTYVSRIEAVPGDRFRGRTLAKDEYALVGDNRTAACDSRVWGPLPRRRLIGKAIGRYWPPGRIALGL
jgi:signal peptidase I